MGSSGFPPFIENRIYVFNNDNAGPIGLNGVLPKPGSKCLRL